MFEYFQFKLILSIQFCQIGIKEINAISFSNSFRQIFFSTLFEIV